MCALPGIGPGPDRRRLPDDDQGTSRGAPPCLRKLAAIPFLMTGPADLGAPGPACTEVPQRRVVRLGIGIHVLGPKLAAVVEDPVVVVEAERVPFGPSKLDLLVACVARAADPDRLGIVVAGIGLLLLLGCGPGDYA